MVRVDCYLLSRYDLVVRLLIKNLCLRPMDCVRVSARNKWSASDPEILSEILFAVACVFSFARTTYIMPSHELLGPLQVSFGRVLTDIARFVVLFLLVRSFIQSIILHCIITVLRHHKPSR